MVESVNLQEKDYFLKGIKKQTGNISKTLVDGYSIFRLFRKS